MFGVALRSQLRAERVWAGEPGGRRRTHAFRQLVLVLALCHPAR